MKHPNQAALALHAGGDLSAFARWRMERHLAGCVRCGKEVAAFQATRDSLATLAEMPELPWNHMAAEMRANIRLGLEAGECVRGNESKLPVHFGWRAAVAMASIAALVVTGVILDRPHARTDREETALQTARGGIGTSVMKLMYSAADPDRVQLSASAGGSVQAQYTSQATGYVTVSEVDAQ